MAKRGTSGMDGAEIMLSTRQAKWDHAVSNGFDEIIRLVSRIFFDGGKLPEEPRFYKGVSEVRKQT